jgi:hypothetical protein
VELGLDLIALLVGESCNRKKIPCPPHASRMIEYDGLRPSDGRRGSFQTQSILYSNDNLTFSCQVEGLQYCLEVFIYR